MPSAIVSAKGQVTLPAAMRRTLGLGPGSRVEVILGDGELVIRPMPTILDVKGAFRHCAARGVTWEQERAGAEESVAKQVADEK